MSKTSGSITTKVSSGEAWRIGWVFIRAALWGWIHLKPEVTISTSFTGEDA